MVYNGLMIFIGADHRGFGLKEYIKDQLEAEGQEVTDVGDKHLEPEDDYVDFAKAVAEKVLENPEHRGILLCGSGVGVDIVANKFTGIRSALVGDVDRAVQSREHEDINVLSLPADILEEETALKIVKAYLETPFSGEERHVRRLEKIKKIEEEV